MTAQINEAGDILIGEIDGFLGTIFLQLPTVAVPSNGGKSQQRLYPLPSATEEDAEAWRDFVVPELRALFESATATVACDLETLDFSDNDGKLRIPAAHLDAWMNTLNRARLVLVEEFEFTEEDMELGVREMETSADMARMQIGVYGLLLEFLVREQLG